MAYREKDKPQEADIEIGGEPEGTDWDEPAADWMEQKKGAVRRAMGSRGRA